MTAKRDKGAKTTLLAYVLILLAAALRCYRLDAQSLWSDEGNSLALAQSSFAEIAARTAFDIHPPFYYCVLKIWLTLFGSSEFAARSLSAMLGVLLVALIYRLGARLFNPKVGLAAAFVAALSPFQVYYAQEARMYMLLTVLGAASVLLAAEEIYDLRFTIYESETRNLKIAYVIVVTLGLYTQYAFPVMLAVINLTAIVVLWPQKKRLWAWLGLQLIPLIFYLPWLPIAYRQITTWPSLVEKAPLNEIALALMRQLSLGPSASAVSDWWLVIFGVIALLGIIPFATRHASRSFAYSPIRPFAHSLILLWLLIPAGLTAILFRPAYLKFLLIASPAFCLLLGLGITFFPPRKKFIPSTALRTSLLPSSFILFITLPSLLSLNALYHNSAFQRDNYRGIAAFIQAIANSNDAVVIHAPGQQEVFGYYYQSGPGQATVYPLPKQRPLDPDAAVADLKAIAVGSKRIYAVYWAAEEADPEGLIENWLNQNTFKAKDLWFGNVRLVSYATSAEEFASIPVDFQLGEHIRLTGYAFSPEEISPGDILQVSLTWQTDAPLKDDYTVFIQLLDEANHLVGQRDAKPLTPTGGWTPDQPVNDQHGLVIEPGTPPTPQRLILGLYNPATGERLIAANGQDYIELAPVLVLKNQAPLPVEAFRMQYQLSGPPLLGYDLYKLGHASNPNAPLHPGDPLHVNLYWQKPSSLPDDDAVELRLVNSAGEVVAAWESPAAGVNYPMSNWVDGEIVRGQFDLFLSDVSPGEYRLEVVLGGEVVVVIQKIEVED